MLVLIRGKWKKIRIQKTKTIFPTSTSMRESISFHTSQLGDISKTWQGRWTHQHTHTLHHGRFHIEWRTRKKRRSQHISLQIPTLAALVGGQRAKVVNFSYKLTSIKCDSFIRATAKRMLSDAQKKSDRKLLLRLRWLMINSPLESEHIDSQISHWLTVSCELGCVWMKSEIFNISSFYARDYTTERNEII